MNIQKPAEAHPCYCGTEVFAHEPDCTGRPVFGGVLTPAEQVRKSRTGLIVATYVDGKRQPAEGS
jgi:hypothetical protein